MAIHISHRASWRRVRAGALVTLLVAAVGLAGCSASEANPHLAAPKLLVHQLEDGNVTLYVHAAFDERTYDRISLALENVTVATRTDAFSLETKVASPGFFVEVTAELGEERYHLRARMDVLPENERILVATLGEDDTWTDADQFVLPYTRIMERVTA